MILNKEQIRTRHDWNEYERRSSAPEGSIEKLTTLEIKELLKIPFTKEELRAERKRRVERLRYLRIMANPFTRAQYKDRKRMERLARW